jgi:hypothetical protein
MASGRTADGAASRARGAALLRAVLLRGCTRQSVAACRRSRASGACGGAVPAVPAVPAAHRDRQARYGSLARQSGGAAAVLRHPLLPGRAQPSDAALPADAELLAVRGRGGTPARSGPRKLADRMPPAALPARRRRFRPGAVAGLDGGWPCLGIPCRSVGGPCSWGLLASTDATDMPPDVRTRSRQFSAFPADLALMCPERGGFMLPHHTCQLTKASSR